MKTTDLTKTDKKFIKWVMEKYAESLKDWPKFNDKGRITTAARHINQALLIARYKLRKF